MKKELEDKLYDKYPKIFGQKDLPPQQSLMCFGVSCQDGWYTLIDQLCKYLQYTTDERQMPQVEAVQVKEKFGGLSFYVGGANDVQHEVIWFAESLSLTICEWCGQPGETRGGSWARTLCDPCESKDQGGYKPWREED